MIFFILFELIKINLFKKDNEALLTGLISMILLGFGLYLAIKYGLLLDYGTADEIINSNAKLMSFFAIANILTGLSFILFSIFKFLIWKVKNAHNKK